MGVMQQKRPTKLRPAGPPTPSPPTVPPQTPLTAAAPIIALPKVMLPAPASPPKVILPAAASSPPKVTLPAASSPPKVTVPTVSPPPKVTPPAVQPQPPAVTPPPVAALNPAPTTVVIPPAAQAANPVLPTSASQTDSTAVNAHTDIDANSGIILMKLAVDHDHALASAAAVTVESVVKSSPEGLNIVTNVSDKDRNADGQERVTVPSSDRETEGNLVRSADEELGLKLNNLTLCDDKDNDDLTCQLKELKIKEKTDHEEHTEESGLVSRGPDRIATKGSRPIPYLLEQHYVSSDRHGGATVLYPNIAQQQFGSCQHLPPQEISPSCWQGLRGETRFLTYNNSQNVQECVQKTSVDELQNILYNPSLPKTPLTEADLKILEDLTNKYLNSSEENQANIGQQNSTVTQHFSQPSPDEGFSDSFGFDIDQIIVSDKYDRSIQDVKQELSKEGLPPTPPDSEYDSDEGTIVSSASTTISVGLQRETENIQLVNPSFPTVITQNNILQQAAHPASSVTPILHTVPPGVVLSLLVQQNPQPVASPTTVQTFIPPPTPPLLSLTPRPILPGENIPSPCTEPAIKRITSLMTEKVKDAVWAIIFAKPDSDFINADEDGNKVLGYMLSNRHKYKNFMEVFHVVIQRLKRIIQGNQDMAYKLLAAPNRCGHTPLDLACRYFQSGEQDALVVRYLADTMVEGGLKIWQELDESSNKSGNTLLHKICNYGDKSQYIMAELLSMKDRNGNSVFDVNRENSEGKTPLHVAALKHSDQTPCTVLAQLLMRSGASASKQEGCSGNTVFHCVASVSCDPNLLLTLLAVTKDVEKVVNTPNFNGDTPLHMVAANPTVTLEDQRLAVQHLIHYEAQPTLKNRSGRAPLSLVALDRKQDIKTVLYHK